MDELDNAYRQAHELLTELKQKQSEHPCLGEAIRLAERLAENLNTNWDKIVETAIEQAMAEGRGENG